MIEQLYATYLASRQVTTDSRTITPGCLFFALKGDHFDAGAFVPQALAQGAALCITSWPQYRDNPRCLVVDDVLLTLQQLATYHRQHLDMPIVGITGTNGKTTTKELVHAVLSRRYRTAATVGNHNNHIGVPLTLLAIPPNAEIAIVEMGANHPNEIDFLCRIAQPTHGLITNCGRAHLEGFGSAEGVFRTKTELYRHLAQQHGTIFYNASDAKLEAEARRLAAQPETRLTLVSYGDAAQADAHGSHIADDPFLRFYFEVGDEVFTVPTHLLGGYNFDNCMAAVAVGLHFHVAPFDIRTAIADYESQNQRSQWVNTTHNRLYLDCYNANPSSMQAALTAFRSIEAEHKVAIIGGMHELGADADAEHRLLVAQLADCALDGCMLIGPEFDNIPLDASMMHFADTDTAADHLRRNPLKGSLILVKGSNTNHLWTLKEWL